MRRYYVYELVDPRSDEVFYIGKGRRGRIDAHEREAMRGGISPKCARIRDIAASGDKVVKRKVEHFDDEQAAYDFEAALVAKYGLDNLTNMVPGGGSARTEITIEADREILLAAAEMANRTRNGLIEALIINGQRLDLAAILEDYKRRASEAISRRGLDWANKLVAKHGVRFADA